MTFKELNESYKKETKINKEEAVAFINSLIVEAIDHGGDAGGPYGANTNRLTYAMQDLREVLNLKDYQILWPDEIYPQFININEEDN